MARYDIARKIDRNSHLIQYREDHPEATLEEIGRIFNITRQRVGQLLKLYQDGNSGKSPAK